MLQLTFMSVHLTAVCNKRHFLWPAHVLVPDWEEKMGQVPNVQLYTFSSLILHRYRAAVEKVFKTNPQSPSAARLGSSDLPVCGLHRPGGWDSSGHKGRTRRASASPYLIMRTTTLSLCIPTHWLYIPTTTKYMGNILNLFSNENVMMEIVSPPFWICLASN